MYGSLDSDDGRGSVCTNLVCCHGNGMDAEAPIEAEAPGVAGNRDTCRLMN